jgi:uncharacterized protein YqfB (UPF0267 family)
MDTTVRQRIERLQQRLQSLNDELMNGRKTLAHRNQIESEFPASKSEKKRTSTQMSLEMAAA